MHSDLVGVDLGEMGLTLDVVTDVHCDKKDKQGNVSGGAYFFLLSNRDRYTRMVEEIKTYSLRNKSLTNYITKGIQPPCKYTSRIPS